MAEALERGERTLRVLRELPLVWFLIGASLAWLCAVLLRSVEPERRRTLARRIGLGAGLLTLGLYVALNLAAGHCVFFQGDEADILAISAASLHGQPVYHSLHSAEFGYSLRYGPVTFLLYRAVLALCGGGFLALRAVVLAANLLVCLSLYSIFRKALRRDVALALLALPLGAVMEQMRYALGMRADIWILLTVALATRAAMMDVGLWAGVLTGICLGLAVDLKVTVLAAALLVVLLLYRRHGLRSVVTAAVLAAAVGLAPFALPEFSLPNYVAWLHAVPGGLHSISPDLVVPALAYAAFLLLPLLLLQWAGIGLLQGSQRRTAVALWASIVGCALAVAWVADKPGTGVWHFWQLIPVQAGYLAMALGSTEASSLQGKGGSLRREFVVLALALGGMAIGLSFAPRDATTVSEARAQAVELRRGRVELEAYLSEYRGRTLQVGYGQWHGTAEWLRYLPVLHGEPYTLDGSPRLEEFFESFPDGVITRMDHCSDDVWLIPHGERPFTFTYVFPPALHDTFVRRYAIERQGAELDAWTCRAR